MAAPAPAPLLATGIPNLDRVLGGGFPAEDVLLVLGQAGTGKTTLCLQMLCHAARRGQNVVYVSTVSEPATKLLRHMRSFRFFDESLIGRNLFFLSAYPIIKQSLEAVFDALVQMVQEHHAAVVVIDGLMSLHDLHPNAPEVRTFIYELGAVLATLNCTTIVTSSGWAPVDQQQFPEYTMADGIVELATKDLGPQTVRRLRVRKIRGQTPLLGEHSLQIDENGIAIYPRLESVATSVDVGISPEKMPTGMNELDALMSGGPRAGSLTLIAGGLGTGKTLASLQFIMAGAARGERGLFIEFRETQQQLIDKARIFGYDLGAAISAGQIEIIRRLPVDLDVDKVTWNVFEAIDRFAPRRVVIDSITEVQDALPPDRYVRGFMSALAGQLHDRHITSFIVHEIPEVVGTELEFSDTSLAALSENLILMRWVEFHSEIYRILSVLKMRESAYDSSIRQFVITDRGLQVLQRMETAEGLLTGIARSTSEQRRRPRREE
jgi:circadian clock protein KaiC